MTRKGSVSLDEFRRAVRNVVSQEPFASRFTELSASGDRRGMVEMLMETRHAAGLRPGDSYQGKSDAQAAVLYERSRRAEPGGEGRATQKTGTRDDALTQALFAASANSRLFLDALCERARRSYSLRAYASCLRDCECVSALPASFYDGCAAGVRYFVQRRKECLQLERECSRKLEAGSTRKRSAGRGKASSSSVTPNLKNSSSLGRRPDVTTPTVDGKRHRCLVSCADSVTLRYDAARGRYLVATRDIRPGAVLVVDRPFSYSTDAPALARNCLHCHATLKLEDSVGIPCRNCQTVSFCAETCRREAWDRYHRYECSVFDHFFENASNSERRQRSHLLLAYRTTVLQALPVDTSKQPSSAETERALSPDFLRYHANDHAESEDDDVGQECAELGTKKPYSPLDYRTVLQLETHRADTKPGVNLARAIEAVFLAKCLVAVLSEMDVVCTRETFVPLAVAMLRHLQAIDCNAYEVIENVRDEATRVWEPRNIGGAIYTTVSLVNHSCYPNVVRHCYPNGTVVVRALRSISKGREILDCYGPQFLSESRLTRREFLLNKYRFLCECDACAHDWTFPLPEAVCYKCASCSGPLDSPAVDANAARTTAHRRCARCEKTIDLQKIEKQLHKSIQKRLSAIALMYEGDYRAAMLLLFEHANFVNRHLVEPNIEGVKTEQCIVQCYNSLGSTSV